MPSERIEYLSVDEVVEMHRVLVECFGGPAGIRDFGLLEVRSFARRPATIALADMAAALFESLLMNHPFVDGNKRFAFFATDVFLRLNGWKLQVEASAAHAFLIALLDEGRANFAHLLPWLRRSLVRHHR